MPTLIDDYRKSWALHFMKEANIELFRAKENSIQNVSQNFALTSMKKAQTAIYYSLGDPEYLTWVVKEALYDNDLNQDLVMRLLTRIERFIHFNHKNRKMIKSHTLLIREAEELVNLASKIVELMVGEET
jgi:hypothetical protein